MSQQLTAWPTGEKDKILSRIAQHRELDEIVQGTGFENGKGCAIGCSLDSYDHREYQRVVGVDGIVSGLIDWCHENLPAELSKDWPGRVAKALKSGADTTFIADWWYVWLLTEDLKSMDPDGVCAKMGELFRRAAEGDEPTKAEWDREARAAWAAWEARAAREAWKAWAAREAWAARAAWEAGAARAAWEAGAAWEAWEAREAREAREAGAAWEARAAWAARAARAAWEARVAGAAGEAFVLRAANKLIEIMENCK
jgi:hypothetical protein